MLKQLFISTSLMAAVALVQPASANTRLRLDAVTPQVFCTNLITSLAGSSLLAGSSQAKLNQAIRVSGSFVQLLKAGNIAPIMPISQLGLSITELEPEFPRYVTMSGLLKAAMAESNDYILALDVDELKYLPYSKHGAKILLLVDNTEELTPDRAKVVMHVARRFEIAISTIWYGPPGAGGDGAQTGLAVLAAMTGGKFMDLNWLDGCGEPSH